MPWNKTSTMDQKRLFIKDYIRGAFAMAELCRRYGISRPTGYKWVARFEAAGLPGRRAVGLRVDVRQIDLYVMFVNRLPPFKLEGFNPHGQVSEGSSCGGGGLGRSPPAEQPEPA